jgi:hypothetical protein
MVNIHSNGIINGEKAVWEFWVWINHEESEGALKNGLQLCARGFCGIL